jgi:hypothetical protein
MVPTESWKLKNITDEEIRSRVTIHQLVPESDSQRVQTSLSKDHDIRIFEQYCFGCMAQWNP